MKGSRLITFCSWAMGCQRTKWARQGLTEIKSIHRHVHTQKSLWKMCCLTLHEWTQQLRHLAKLQWEKGSTAKDFPGCPLSVSPGWGERVCLAPEPWRAERQQHRARDGNIPGCVPKQTAIKQTANEDATWPSAECMPKDRRAARGREGLCRQKLQAQGDFLKGQPKKKKMFGYFAGNKSYSRSNTEQTLLWRKEKSAKQRTLLCRKNFFLKLMLTFHYFSKKSQWTLP